MYDQPNLPVHYWSPDWPHHLVGISPISVAQGNVEPVGGSLAPLPTPTPQYPDDAGYRFMSWSIFVQNIESLVDQINDGHMAHPNAEQAKTIEAHARTFGEDMVVWVRRMLRYVEARK